MHLVKLLKCFTHNLQLQVANACIRIRFSIAIAIRIRTRTRIPLCYFCWNTLQVVQLILVIVMAGSDFAPSLLMKGLREDQKGQSQLIC